MLKVGIAGVRGLSGLLGFRSAGVQIDALCDIDSDILDLMAEKHGIPHKYQVFDDMLMSDIDMVVVATPMQCHIEQTLKALNAGKHVLSEVTAGVSMDELFFLCETVEKSDKVYMLAENYCYSPHAMQIKNMVAAGVFGDIYFAEGEYLHDVRELTHYEDGRPTWRNYWQLGVRGCFYPTHSAGPVMQWYKSQTPDVKILEVSCFGTGTHTDPRFKQDDTTITMLRLSDDRLVKLRVDCISNRPHNMSFYSLQGTKGAYEAPRGLGDTHKIYIGENGNGGWRPLSDFEEYVPQRYKNADENARQQGHNGGDFFIIKDFVDAVEGKTKPVIDVYDACEWTAIAILSNISTQNGFRAMKMPDFKDKNRRFII